MKRKNSVNDSTLILILSCSNMRNKREVISVSPSAVQAVIKEEARDNYRQNIMRPAALSKVNEEPREVPCTILNVSATGIALQSPGLFQIGDILELTRQRFRVRGPEHTVKCKVVRMRGLAEGGYFYGCQFVELTQEEENRLYQDMFAL